jgi:hypothetical protein
MGESLLEPMEILVVWANQHFDKVMEARKRFDGVNLASGPTSATPPPSAHKPTRELTE